MVRIKYDGVWRNAADTRNLPSEKDGVELAQIVLQNQSDWELKGDGYYYYKNALAPNSITSSLFQKVVLNLDANFGVDNVCTSSARPSAAQLLRQHLLERSAKNQPMIMRGLSFI